MKDLKQFITKKLPDSSYITDDEYILKFIKVLEYSKKIVFDKSILKRCFYDMWIPWSFYDSMHWEDIGFEPHVISHVIFSSIFGDSYEILESDSTYIQDYEDEVTVQELIEGYIEWMDGQVEKHIHKKPSDVKWWQKFKNGIEDASEGLEIRSLIVGIPNQLPKGSRKLLEDMGFVIEDGVMFYIIAYWDGWQGQHELVVDDVINYLERFAKKKNQNTELISILNKIGIEGPNLDNLDKIMQQFMTEEEVIL